MYFNISNEGELCQCSLPILANKNGNKKLELVKEGKTSLKPR